MSDDDATTDLADLDGRSLADEPSHPEGSSIRQLYRGTNDFDIPRWYGRFAVISIVLLLVSVGAIAMNGLNLSIDFEGGSVWEVPGDFTQEQAGEVFEEVGITGVRYQEATSFEGDRLLRITGQVESVQEGAEVAGALSDAAGLERGEVTVNTVGPSWGDDITRQARNSLVVFLVLVFAYIAWRLEARMAIAAIVTVVHDIVITVGFYAMFSVQITPATVIAFLTILGFSLYDTIVVYDRVLENAERLGRSGRYTYRAIMRRSLNQVFMRSVNTTITTLLPVASLIVLGRYIYGQQTLMDFSLALFIGLALGTYSSLFVAAPITDVLKEREPRWKEVRERLAGRGIDVKDTRWQGIGPTPAAVAAAASAAGPPGSSTAGSSGISGTGSSGGARPTAPGGHPPRPRKKRR